MENSRFKCNCGEMLEITPGVDIIKCHACGRPWLEKQWQQKLSPSIGELSVPEDISAVESPGITGQKKTLPATQMLDNDQILAIKEASVKMDEEEAARKKKYKRPLPATQMFSSNEIEDIKKASIEGQGKKDEK